MDWLSLEGIPRVKASYRVWKHSVKLLRRARKDPNVLKKTIRYLKEDVQTEYDELADAILCLTHAEYRLLLSSLKHNRLYDLLCTLPH